MKVTFEGFIETDSGNEFDMNLLMVHPVRMMTHPGNVGGIDQLVEECAIDLHLGEELQDDKLLLEELLLPELEKAKLGDDLGTGALYWKRVVEISDDEEVVYREVERVGA